MHRVRVRHGRNFPCFLKKLYKEHECDEQSSFGIHVHMIRYVFMRASERERAKERSYIPWTQVALIQIKNEMDKRDE